MLVCPQCQFENPDENRFCQQCGTSLTDKPCHACGALVVLDAETCPQCGAPVALIYRAVMMPEQPQAIASSFPLPQAIASPADSPSLGVAAAATESASTPTLPPTYVYLDAQHRYRLLTPLPPVLSATGSEVQVMDCQPYQPTRLELLANPLGESSEGLSASLLGVPAIAQTYLELEQQLYPSVPSIRDSWTMEDHTIVLLEDRSTLTPLAELWRNPELPPFQMLHLMHQMVELWSALQPYQQTQSLLELENLRVDEDQLLYLQRLYGDRQVPPSLSELGRVWELLFQQQDQPQLHPDLTGVRLLQELVTAVEAGKWEQIEAVRSHLELLADQLQLPTEPPTDASEFMDVYPEDRSPLEAAPSQSAGEPEPLIPVAGDRPDDLPNADSDLIIDDEMLSTIRINDPDEDATTEADDVPTIVLPMKLVSIEDAGRSDIGRQRDHNEDNFSIQTDIKKIEGLSGRTLQVRGLYILCDGMGGHEGGEVASALAVETLREFFQKHWQDFLPSEEMIRQGILEANRALYEINQQDDREGSGRMGTTLVLVLVQDNQAAIAHVGDSRLYRYSRRQGLEQLTDDHDVGQREIQRGVDPIIAYGRPDAYQLTQALGPRDENFVSPDVQFLELNEDLLLLLCSDGLSDKDLIETHCSTHVEPLLSSQTNLEYGINQLIDLANQYNGHDNITAIAIRARVRPNLEKMRRDS